VQHKKSLGQRMKENYEFRAQTHLTRRTPVIIRLDGRSFHTLTKRFKLEKPFDLKFNSWMQETVIALCEEIQGAKLGYTQSDEISILMVDYDNLDSEAWFNYNVQKVVSVSASIATEAFTNAMINDGRCWPVSFDSRAFNIPREEANNYFVWRQQDWIKNSVQMLARAHYSHKELQSKNQSDMHEMLYQKGINWANLDDWKKNGVTFTKEVYDRSDGGPELVIRHSWDDDPTLIFSKEPKVVNELIGLKND